MGVTVWYAISVNGIIRPLFFEDETEKTMTVNSQRYFEMLHNFLTPQIDKLPVSLCINQHFSNKMGLQDVQQEFQ